MMDLYYFKRQLLWVFVALIGLNIIVNLPLQKILGISHWFVWCVFGINFRYSNTRIGKKSF